MTQLVYLTEIILAHPIIIGDKSIHYLAKESLRQGGAYCKKRIFPVRKTSETKQMLIHFFDLKKGLFPLFRAFSVITTVLFAITTVLMCSVLGTSRRLARS